MFSHRLVNYIIAASVATSLYFASCSSKDDSDLLTPTIVSRLTSYTWHIDTLIRVIDGDSTKISVADNYMLGNMLLNFYNGKDSSRYQFASVLNSSEANYITDGTDTLLTAQAGIWSINSGMDTIFIKSYTTGTTRGWAIDNRKSYNNDTIIYAYEYITATQERRTYILRHN